MQAYFYTLADFLETQLQAAEIYLCTFEGEQSSFIRFNQAQVRQAGQVEQYRLNLHLIHEQRHALAQLTLSGDLSHDQTQLQALLTRLRQQLPHLPADPYLLYATEVCSTDDLGEDQLPRYETILTDILQTVASQDFVGIYAGGPILKGFANSFGQRNWHSRYSFNLDWSRYHQQDKAVKCNYAGFNWVRSDFAAKVAATETQLALLKQTPKTISPGQYRVYLAPAALYEIMQLLCWGGFGLKAQRTKQTPLLRMLEAPEQRLHEQITLIENTQAGIAPRFQEAGFMKPEQVILIEHGRYHTALVSPRSAQEYGIATNGANSEEVPISLELAAGSLTSNEILKTLGTGIYINNLWYLNYSDRAGGRMTGMTRFATFWVERGEIVAPLNVMRFDETLYHLLGDKLIALTAGRDFIMDTDTYEHRAVSTAQLPGALIEGFTLTL